MVLTYILIDTSYVIFCVYYATLKHYKSFINPTPDISSLSKSPLFYAAFKKLFSKKISEIMQRNGVAWNHILFAMDCDRETIWRKQVFKHYKESRSEKHDFNTFFFTITVSDVIPGLTNTDIIHIVQQERAEADDVIFVCHEFIRNAQCNAHVVIVTNDNDYIQLQDEHTTIVNLMGHDICLRKPSNLSPLEYLKCKALCGDKCDNITGAVPRCGIKTAAKTVGNLKQMQLIEQTESYRLNMQLMDMRNIPCYLKTMILHKLKHFLDTVV